MLDWTQILSVINLQRQRGTAPQSRVSSRQHVSPGENTVYVCVCVCVCVCNSVLPSLQIPPTNHPVLPYSQRPCRSARCDLLCWRIWMLTLYWHDMPFFSKLQKPQSPRRWWWWASESNAGVFLVSPLLRRDSPSLRWATILWNAADEFVDGGVKSK